MDHLKLWIRKFYKEKPMVVQPECSRQDFYYAKLYQVLSWEDPWSSLSILAVIHVLFWAIVYYEIKLFGFIILSVVTVLLADRYVAGSGITGPRTPETDCVRNVFNNLRQSATYLRKFRNNNPGAFCILMCAAFSFLLFAPKCLSGYFLAYVDILAIYFGPLIISKLPESYREFIMDGIQMIVSNEGMLAETELIPFITDKDLTDKDPELESLLTDKTADSITNSLISGLNSMPSYLDEEGSVDGLEEDDLMPRPRPQTAEIKDYSSDSDSEHMLLKFEADHFSSSSEDEMHYAAGLRFSEDREVVDAGSANMATSIAQNIAAGLMNMSSVGTKVIANVLSKNKEGEEAIRKSSRHSSDSDFEIINTDELRDDGF